MSVLKDKKIYEIIIRTMDRKKMKIDLFYYYGNKNENKITISLITKETPNKSKEKTLSKK